MVYKKVVKSLAEWNALLLVYSWESEGPSHYPVFVILDDFTKQIDQLEY